MQADPVILYEKQLTYVRAVLNRFPQYLEVLADEDKSAFSEYFLPDWESVGHLYRYYKHLHTVDPHFMAKADVLLRRFIIINNLHDQVDLHPV